ncbi:MAG: DnaB-like helicase terminal domain [bacterium]|nr:DnaB-like helicase terminal domain [bacterium]
MIRDDLDHGEHIAGAIEQDAAFVVPIIRATKFKRPELPLPLRNIVGAGVSLFDEGKHVDPETVEQRLRDEGVIETLNCRGGARYIYELFLAVPTPYSVAWHVRQLRRENLMRFARVLGCSL